MLACSGRPPARTPRADISVYPSIPPASVSALSRKPSMHQAPFRRESCVLLSYAITHHLLDAALLPPLLRSVRAALFPHNSPGTSSLAPPSSAAELAALRRRCAAALWSLVPASTRPVARLILLGADFASFRGGDDDELILDELERGVLVVFGDAYCNKHLVYGAVELLLVRLLPELGDKGVVELWGERIS
ncbi:hypothetical protein B0T18DRAFT_394662 [Schizothecium vesticola]|uniref:Uncharacterized protein n=1 Tax=Schizothecium vesticola TaxID=314040 RepID=A0AA40BQ64_9PEZI|nr:hypothetical protein B0T18DRAFT_394662 [Schizothecium vesticola]